MSKTRLIIFGSLIIIGIIGFVTSAILSLPYVNNRVAEAEAYEKKMSTVTKVYEETVDVENIQLDLKNSDVEILTHDQPTIIVSKTYLDKAQLELDIKADQSEKLLKVIQTSNYEYDFKPNYGDIKEFIENHLQKLVIGYKPGKIQITVPKSMNWKIYSHYGSVSFSNKSAINEKVVFKTSSGHISFEENVDPKGINTLEIESLDVISLDATELTGFRNVFLQADNVLIEGSNYSASLFDEVDKNGYLTENIEVNSQSIFIESRVPLARNMDIRSRNDSYGSIQISLPFDKMDTNFQLNGHPNQIYLEGFKNPDGNVQNFRYEGKFIKEDPVKYNLILHAAEHQPIHLNNYNE